MNYIIDEKQTGSVPGRDIRVNVLIARAFLENIEKYEKGGALLLDFEKAYDQVDREFLEWCLMQLGFSDNFVGMVMLLHSCISARVLTRDGVSVEIPVESGVRQGCPIAPYLYVISMLPLLLGIKECEAITIKGVRVWASAFVNDMVVYYRDEADAKNKIELVREYELASGQKLNLDKSECIALQPPGDLIRLQNFFGTNTCTTLLGAPLNVNGYIGDLWKTKINIIKAWKAVSLTIFEKAKVCKVYIISKFQYLFNYELMLKE